MCSTLFPFITFVIIVITTVVNDILIKEIVMVLGFKALVRVYLSVYATHSNPLFPVRPCCVTLVPC